ncbi:hypothetical protein ISF_09760 [Cordyceps fumosorosea ARSEF 2679]|uniref:Uncharacterized protein n=1 Tax=Cordyceps fumosorosea (strain ARSEF 2679) TaxID=1081104 RepID=A0A167D1B9_CORFA|nr:hypothetical protein ISF_09760 [Cordyceps fumosorosea ARSEF 2679]OAA41832.1 hypothetical protein ISF_09760 [Cordyceps fumosorosea ARSEF 2679]
MQFKTPIFVLAAIAGASAFAIPEDLEDGMYSVNLVDGEHIWEKLSEAPAAPEESTPNEAREVVRELTTRDDRLRCGCVNRMSAGECNVVSKFAGVVAFVCNTRASDATVYRQQFADAYRIITDNCGYYMAGTLVGDVNIGYMRLWETNNDVCASALYSNNHHC